jgi:serralysin
VVGGSWILDGTGTDAWNVLGGSLGGSAVLGAVNVASGATLSPGASTGVLSTGNLSLAAGATLLAEIAGTIPGVGHDQVQVSGSVNLAGTLSLSVGAVAPGTTFTLIDNDGADAVTGSFAGLAEGAIVDAGTARFSISYQGGSGNDVVLTALPRGTADDDGFAASAAAERIDALAGIDTVTFGFRLVDAAVSYIGNTVVIDGPSSHTVLTGVERFVFTDGIVENNDRNVLVDDLFYYSRYHDVWNAHIDADAHFRTDGGREDRDPNAFFDVSIYLTANPDVAVSGVDPLAHFDQGGWREGRIPSTTFDPQRYLAANPDVMAAGVDPLWHYLQFGYQEGRAPLAPAALLAGNGFDFVHYLQHNPDVAASGADPLGHFLTFGWKEGRDPNALFDTGGYLAHYADVAAAGINPFDHYNAFGWREGRDPSVDFDTTSYLAAYPDVAAAHVNPLLHYLQSGFAEGRQAFADGVWG